MNVFEIPKPMFFIGNPRKPIGSMYCIFAYIGSIFMVNSGKYSIHGSYGKWYDSNWKHIHLISRIHGTFVYIYLHEVILYPSSPGSLSGYVSKIFNPEAQTVFLMVKDRLLGCDLSSSKQSRYTSDRWSANSRSSNEEWGRRDPVFWKCETCFLGLGMV